MAVDSAKVKELRERTGLPMMDCKKALEKTNGDVDLAFEELRKEGHKAQCKLAGRTAKEGRIGANVSSDGKVGVLVALCCETEPVSKNESFQQLLRELVDVMARNHPKDAQELGQLKLPSGHTVSTTVTDLVNKIRENIGVGRFARGEGDAVIQYVHFDQKKAAMVALKGGAISDPKVAEVGKELGMHIVFSNSDPSTKPLALSRDLLDPKIVEKEREILLEMAKKDPKNSKKPEQILQKIIQGQVDKFVSSKCLLEQPYARDPTQSVSQYIKSTGTGLTVSDFVYVATDLS